MKCIVCKRGNLEVVNSRKQAKSLRVWRRRKCSACGTLLTTNEIIDYDRTFIINVKGERRNTRPFEKSALLAQLFAAGGHLRDKNVLFYVAETIALKAFLEASKHEMTISSNDYHSVALNVLGAYDKLLAANFRARFGTESYKL